MSKWATDTKPTRWGIHVFPLDDDVPHDIESHNCMCGPKMEFVDGETGTTYPSGPLVVHHSLDGREFNE